MRFSAMCLPIIIQEMKSKCRGGACGKGGKEMSAFEDDTQADTNHNKRYAADAEDEA